VNLLEQKRHMETGLLLTGWPFWLCPSRHEPFANLKSVLNMVVSPSEDW